MSDTLTNHYKSYTEAELTHKCFMCGVITKQGTSTDDMAVSHGVCEKCRPGFLADEKPAATYDELVNIGTTYEFNRPEYCQYHVVHCLVCGKVKDELTDCKCNLIENNYFVKKEISAWQ